MSGINLDLETNLGDEPKVSKPRPSVPAGRVRIFLEEDENIPPTGLYVGHNGMSYMLRPGMEMNVPLGVLEILDNAVVSVPVVNPVSRQTIGYRSKRRYSYRLI